jgi:hypothetical protein
MNAVGVVPKIVIVIIILKAAIIYFGLQASSTNGLGLYIFA